MRGLKLIALSGLLVFFVVGVLAGFSYKGNDLIKSYSGGEVIRGRMNISFDEEKFDSLFTTNLDGEITLFNFLENNSLSVGEDYNCSTPKCNLDYSIGSEVSEIGFSNSKVLGLRVSGSDITSIESFSFRVQSDLGPSCVTPISIDLLDDSDKIMISNNYQDGSFCGGTNSGCYDSGAGTSEVRLTTTDYCNEVTLPRASGFRLGATVKNSTNENSADLKMELYNAEGGFIESCTLPKHTEDEQELDCLLEYANTMQEDYLVCIKRGTIVGNGEPDYKIKSETSGDVCGTDNLGLTFTRDYDLFLKTLRYGVVDFYVNSTNYNEQYGENIKSETIEYILNNYDGKCSPSCVIPVKFSGPSQTLTFSDVDFSFKDGNTFASDNKIYDVTVESPIIDSDYLTLDISKAGFTAPYDTNQDNFRLYLDGARVFDEPITITEGLNFDVNPKFAAFGISTEFKVSFGDNVTSSNWDFGDGFESSSTGSMAHTFTEEGNFEVTVEVTSGNLTGAKTFNIVVGNAKESGKITIDDYKVRLTDIKKDILIYPTWLGNFIDDSVGIEDLEVELEGLENRYNKAENDANYTSIMLSLLELEVPKSINSTIGGELPLLIGFDNIDVNYIEALSSREASDESLLKDAISGWMADNFNGKIEFDYITGSYDSGLRTIVSSFKLDLAPIGEPDDSYLIIQKNIGDLTFSSTHGEKSTSDATYISLNQKRKILEFVVVGKESAESLGIHISPSIALLDIADTEPTNEEDKGFNWWIFIIGIIVLLILAFVIYIFMQEWYKRNYEHHLFKNDSDLYNLVNFIYNGRKAGMNDGQIRFKLKKSKWNAEQIGYAIKKLEGKRTGMWQIPLFRGSEKTKVMQEIQKRQNPRFAH